MIVQILVNSKIKWNDSNRNMNSFDLFMVYMPECKQQQ
jgi:hypothetical protein